MGNILPDRLFWAQPDEDDDEERRRRHGHRFRPATARDPPLMTRNRTRPTATTPVRTRLARHSRRGQLTRARVSRRGRHAALRAARSRPYFWDAEGKRYIDYIGSWGPMILGHGHPAVQDAVERAMREGFSFGAPTEREIELAEVLIDCVP